MEATKPTLYLWEGVTYDLSHEAMEKTFRTMGTSRTSPPASVVVFDYTTDAVIQRYRHPFGRLNKAILKAVRESQTFLDSQRGAREGNPGEAPELVRFVVARAPELGARNKAPTSARQLHCCSSLKPKVIACPKSCQGGHGTASDLTALAAGAALGAPFTPSRSPGSDNGPVALAEREAARRLLRKQTKLEAILDDDSATEPEKAKALRELEPITAFQTAHAQRSKSNAENLVRAGRRAITRLHAHVAAATDAAGPSPSGPPPLCRASIKTHPSPLHTPLRPPRRPHPRRLD